MFLKYKFYNYIIISFILSIFVTWINLFNEHGDIVYFNNLYNSLNRVPLMVFFGTTPQGINAHEYTGEFLFKLTLWISANLSVPKIIFDFIIYYLLFICLFYFIILKKINIYLAIFCLCSSFYIWNIIFSSIKNVLALNFFFLSVIYYLKNKKYFFIFFYTICILVASGNIILYLLIFIINFENRKFLLKEKTIVTIILLCLPIFFSYQLMLSRLAGYNVVAEKNRQQVTQQIVIPKLLNNEKNYLEKKIYIIKKVLEHEYEISLFKITLTIPQYSIDWKNKNLSLNYKNINILKVLFFVFLIFFFKEKKKYILYFSSILFLISGLIAFEKINLFLYLIFLTNLIINYEENIKYSKTKIFLFFIFNFYLLSKQYVMLYNLYFYNVPYQY